MLISTETAFQSLLIKLEDAPLIAVDTEFITGHYYHAKIALVQIALSADEVFAIDPLAVDIRPLGDVLANPNIVKIFHAGDQDLQFLFQETGKWTYNIYDTQLAMGFIGERSAQSLQKIVEKYIGITLPKSAQQSDWLKRPISNKQLEYALNDVRFLPQIYEMQQAELVASGNLLRFTEDIQHRYAQPRADKTYTVYQLSGFHKYPYPQKLKADIAFTFREEIAIKENLHRVRIMTDEALLRLTRISNPTIQILSTLHGIHENFIKRHGQKLLKALANYHEHQVALVENKQEYTFFDNELQLLDFIQLWLKLKAQSLAIAPQLLVTKSDAEILLKTHIDKDEAYLQAFPKWKLEIYLDLYQHLQSGKLSISFADNNFQIKAKNASS